MEKAVPEVKQDMPQMARFLSDEMTDRDRKKMEKDHPRKKKPLPPFLKVLLFLSIITALSLAAFLIYGTFSRNTVTPDTEATVAASVESEDASPVKEKEMKAEGTVVILDKDLTNKKLRLRDPSSGEEYVLNFRDNTVYEDAYGNPMVAEQLNAGDIVDIVVSVHSSDLSSVKIHGGEDSFSFPDITDYDISVNKGIFSYDGQNYRILKGTVVLAGDLPSSFKDIKNGDVLSISGVGRDVYTVRETGGDGFVRITGAESFKGGWVELGNLVRPIEDEMVITVPAGNYTLSVTYQHYGGSKQVQVFRGKETRVDVSDLKGDLLKTGVITFTFEPEEANPAVYIDGKLVIKENPLELDYGVHTLDVKAEGYVYIHKFLKVGQPMANLAIILEENDEDTPSANSSDRNTGKKAEDHEKDPLPSEALPEIFKNTGNNTTNSSSAKPAEEETETVTTDVSQLYIDGPSGAEVYYDGAYKGIAPCHFKKNGGTHVITLMKNGYQTKSYTLNLSSGTDNESYSFNELIEEGDI